MHAELRTNNFDKFFNLTTTNAILIKLTTNMYLKENVQFLFLFNPQKSL